MRGLQVEVFDLFGFGLEGITDVVQLRQEVLLGEHGEVLVLAGSGWKPRQGLGPQWHRRLRDIEALLKWGHVTVGLCALGTLSRLQPTPLHNEAILTAAGISRLLR